MRNIYLNVKAALHLKKCQLTNRVLQHQKILDYINFFKGFNLEMLCQGVLGASI